MTRHLSVVTLGSKGAESAAVNWESTPDAYFLDALRDAAGARMRSQSLDYPLLATSDVMLAMIATDRELWRQISERAGISFEAYETNLRWAVEHSTETVDAGESALDSDLEGIRLTSQLATAAEAGNRIVEHFARRQRPDSRGILPAVLLSLADVDAGTGLSEGGRESLRRAALLTLRGDDISDLDALIANSIVYSRRPEAETSRETSSGTPAPAAELAGRTGFNLGTFLGAFVISLLGGLPLVFALGVGWLVRTIAVRVRRRRRYGTMAPVSVLGLIAAVALAVTAVTGFGEDRQAVAELDTARTAIGEDKLVVAMKNLGSAGLLENESVSIMVLGSCVDWALGYKDYALFEAQVSLTLGYEPEEETHYRGRGCYLDTPGAFRGFDFVKISQAWFIYPLPDKDDAEGRGLLALAENTETPRINDRITALGCLSNRYDMRMLAAFDFTVGVNSAYRLGEGATPFAAIKRCLRAKPMNEEYAFRSDPRNSVEEFYPVDEIERIPSPQRHDPPDVCWAKFPLGGPCGVHE
jgi:hypothetical protein